jgi:predicted thioesterase
LDVFSTPMMIALMEQASCECIAESLEQGQTSVGTQISVEHTEASSIGAEISATAKIENVDGRKISFTVTASSGASQIGSGTHTRVIINAERFMDRLKKA